MPYDFDDLTADQCREILSRASEFYKRLDPDNDDHVKQVLDVALLTIGKPTFSADEVYQEFCDLWESGPKPDRKAFDKALSSHKDVVPWGSVPGEFLLK